MESWESKRAAPNELRTFCALAFAKAGMPEAHARVAGEVLVATDIWGIHTHGTYNALNYVRKILAGGIDAHAVPEVVAEGPGWVSVEGHSAIAMVSSVQAMDLAIKKASTTGIGFAGVRDSNHFGAAAYYAHRAVKHDMIGLAFTNSALCTTAPGSRGGVIGNNPLAYAVPAGNERPLLLDIAMSRVAGTKIEVAKKLGKSIPNDWMVDENGLPTTDVNKFPLESSLLPMAGHKGYALAILVEVLSGVLTGAGVTTELVSWGPYPAERPKTGHAFIAINVGAMMDLRDFKARMDKMIRGIKESPKAMGADRIYLPGEMEWEKHDDFQKRGILLPPETAANLRTLGEELNLSAPSFLP